MVYLNKGVKEDMLGVFVFLIAYPILIMGGMGGVGLIGISIRDWHGNTTNTLLLKLLDEQATPMDSAPH
jgi:hypothetical protein